MAQTKAQRSKAAKKAAATRKKNASKSTPKKKAADKPEPAGPALGAFNTRRDDQAVIGHFAEVVAGEHEGAYGVVEQVAEEKDGEPVTVILRTRDENSEPLVVAYKDCRPAEAGRR